jgi:hypothetical protein
VIRPAKEHSSPEAKAAGYFAALDIALSRGDYAAAAKAQQVLAELGWDVRRHPSRLRPEAAGQGVGR